MIGSGFEGPAATLASVSAADGQDTVLVVDFGAQYAQLIARRVREAHVHSEIVPHTISADEVRARRPAGVILSGGPASVHVAGAPVLDAGLYDTGTPVLGICYGAQLLAQQLGGSVANTGTGEYGRTGLVATGTGSPLFDRVPTSFDVWMSHFDSVQDLPPGFRATASTEGIQVAALEDAERRIYGLQFHPEVAHTAFGQDLLKAFLYDVCGCRPTWTMTSIIDAQVEAIRAQVGDERVICGLSGGVDSAVAAALVHKAVGDQLRCVFVDTGMLRSGEPEQVEDTFRRQFALDLVHVKAADRFLDALNDVLDPERKRTVIGQEFWRVFADAARDLGPSGPSERETLGPSGPPERGTDGDARFLVQGTLYPDVVESGGTGGAASIIKSHHNLVEFPEGLHFELVEPLRDLFKDEVRAVGEELGLPEHIVWRQPFPGPGLAVRIIGTITPERLEILRQADAIVLDEVRRAGLERQLWQWFAVLPAIRSVGVMGDERTYGYPIVIRAVTSDDAMTADWARLPYDLLERLSSRIINEVPGVNRVALDITSKPPGTIEWE